VGEIDSGKLSSISLELLAAGRKLAQAREEDLSMVLIDRQASDFSEEAITHGADRVYLISDAPTEQYEGASTTAILEKLCTQIFKPAVILFG